METWPYNLADDLDVFAGLAEAPADFYYIGLHPVEQGDTRLCESVSSACIRAVRVAGVQGECACVVPSRKRDEIA